MFAILSEIVRFSFISFFVFSILFFIYIRIASGTGVRKEAIVALFMLTLAGLSGFVFAVTGLIFIGLWLGQ